MGGQDVLLVPGPGQPLPHYGVPTRRLVLVLLQSNNTAISSCIFIK